MIQEDKELLLKDLCARLPYNVICSTVFGNSIVLYIDIYEGSIYITNNEWVYDFKPYLRSMSSMTNVEREEYCLVLCDELSINQFDWLNAHHFDYRGLIPMGLAIEVTEENNPYKDNEI